MKKKFIVRDEDKNEFEVEEIEEVKEKDEAEEIEETEKLKDEESLSTEDILALKKLAGIADKLVALVDIEKDEHAGEEEGEMLDEDEDEDEEVEEKEEIIDTDEEVVEEKTIRHDSKKSFGSIAKSKNKDSMADAHESDVAAAWAKRYGGK